MKTSTQAALTERVNSGLRPPTDGSIMAKGGGPGTGGRSAWTSDTVRRADVSVRLLQAIGGAAASLGGGVASGGDQQVYVKRRRPIRHRAKARREVAWAANEIALGGPWAFSGERAAKRAPSRSHLGVQPPGPRVPSWPWSWSWWRITPGPVFGRASLRLYGCLHHCHRVRRRAAWPWAARCRCWAGGHGDTLPHAWHGILGVADKCEYVDTVGDGGG